MEGFIFTTKLGTVGPVVPFKSWITLVVMYFMVSVTNNYALSYHVPMPLHMIFRAGSLMANMLMGMALLGRRYNTTKYMSVLMITIGIATCTVMSATSRVSLKTGKAVFSEDEDKEAAERLMAALEAEQTERFKEMMIGIGLLVFAMLLSARMGVYQVLCLFVLCLLYMILIRKFYTAAMASTPRRLCSTPTLFRYQAFYSLVVISSGLRPSGSM